VTPRFPQSITAGRIVPVLTAETPSTGVAAARALLAGGIHCVEVTLRTARAWEVIEAIRLSVPTLTVGVGTALSAADVERAHRVDAAFVVSPGVDLPSIAAAQEHSIPLLPGIATPTELMAARATGMSLVKVFPSDALGGPGYLRSLAAVFPDMRFVPSGGVSASNAANYLAVSSVSALSGSWMLPEAAVSTGDEETITALSMQAIAAVEGTA